MKKIMVGVMALVAIFAFSGNALAFLDNNEANAGASAGASAVVNMPDQKDLTRSVGKGYRDLPSQGTVPIPGHLNYFGEATRGSQFQGVESVTLYKDTFTYDEMKKMAKGPWGSKAVVTPLVDQVAEEDRAGSIKIVIEKQAGAELLGYVMVKATSEGTVSPEIIAEAMLEARKLGGDTIHVSAEGVERVLKSLGWGIGFSYTAASLNSGENTGSSSTGGTGVSGAKAGYHDNPWIQLFVLKTK